MIDDKYMSRAIELAKLGGGWVNPNPQVGCVIVRDGEIIGEGYHHEFGRPHAEREALADCIACGNNAEGADVYVTLEPCAHFGKTPPCTSALIEARVAKVIIGSNDPNPQVAGAGISRLAEAGIEVECGVLSDECDALNEPFFHYIKTGEPLIIAKYAMTLDGMFATRTGKSRWVTGEASRAKVHADRSRYAAIMIGVRTAIIDDPMLNVRDADGKVDTSAHQPARICVDSNLSLPIDSKLVKTAPSQRTIIVTCNDDVKAHIPYLEHECEMVVVSRDAQGHVDLRKMKKELGKLGLDSVILEGGRMLLAAAFDVGIIDKLQAYISPKVFANSDEPSEAKLVNNISSTTIGSDILLEGNL